MQEKEPLKNLDQNYIDKEFAHLLKTNIKIAEDFCTRLMKENFFFKFAKDHKLERLLKDEGFVDHFIKQAPYFDASQNLKIDSDGITFVIFKNGGHMSSIGLSWEELNNLPQTLINWNEMLED